MKTSLFFILILFAVNAFSGDKGNGGSGTEAELASQQAQLELIGMKIRSFFIQHQDILSYEFPEFKIETLTKKIKLSEIRVVNKTLIDKHGKSRTCLNFPNSSLIKCKYSEIESLVEQPAALFVLVLHEYLGLIGAEETSPLTATVIEGYSISKRLAPYVSHDKEFNLKLNNELSEEQVRLNRLRGLISVVDITSNGWSKVSKKTKRIKVLMNATRAALYPASYSLFVRRSGKEKWSLQSQGNFQELSGSQQFAYIAFESGNEYKICISGEGTTIFEFDSGLFPNLPHTVSLRLTEEDAVIFDSKEVPIEFNSLDPYAEMKGSFYVNYNVLFK